MTGHYRRSASVAQLLGGANLALGVVMEFALALKICGGLIAGIANRFIVRAARSESFAWGICAMFIPGASVLFAVRYRGSLGRPLLAQMCGFALLVTAFVMSANTGVSQGIVGHFRETREAPKRAMAAAENHAAEADEVTVDLAVASPVAAKEKQTAPEDKMAILKTRYDQLQADRGKLKSDAEIAAFNAAAAKYQADLKLARNEAAGLSDETAQRALADAGREVKTAKAIASAPPMWDDLATWYRELERTRKNLDPKDANALKTFNRDAARYASILRERQKQVTKLAASDKPKPAR